MSDTHQSVVRILGIESSCDETAAAVVENGCSVRSNIIASQIAIHEKYGGVVPEIASRHHLEAVSRVVDEALAAAGVTFADIDAIAVTCGPGLVGALLVGLSYAKALAYGLQKPLVGVHHIEGHICANYLENPTLAPPFVCLVVSGGHTNLVLVKEYDSFEVVGSTCDDAAGEAYDKVARALGLGYPGGPKVEAAAQSGRTDAVLFPRVMLKDEYGYQFSFSGLKSAVLNYINQEGMAGRAVCVPDVAASFQAAVADVLTAKTVALANKLGIYKVAMAGGVACNAYLRERMAKHCQANGRELSVPRPVYCTDNAAMIASRGYFSFQKGKTQGLGLNAYPALALGKHMYE